MITLEYDALNGMALPEGMVKPFVTEFIRLNKTKDIKLIFGQELILQEFRLALLTNTLSIDAFRLMFDGHEIKLTYDYKIAADYKKWPKGFCDYSQNCNIDIINATVVLYQNVVD
jgi:hypothetical protein